MLCFVVSCGKKQEQGSNTSGNTTNSGNTNSETKSGSNESKTENKSRNSPAIGSYSGGFTASVYNDTKDYVYENRITIFIDSLSGDMMYGRSVVAGNNRPFKGKYTKEGSNYKAEVTEPGDDKYDGKFSFTIKIDEANTNEIYLAGKWIANDKKLDVTERIYNLYKKDFAYDPQHQLPENIQWAELYGSNPKFPDRIEQLTAEVVKYNGSTTELKKEDLQNLYKGDLEIIRNAIYARHGYSFKNRRVRFIFDQFVPWYMPVSTDVRNELTELEKKNIDLIKRYEEHAEKYYDEYGR
jgi:hypothetical protein